VEKETVTYERECILKVIKDLNILVVSIDRIGAAYHSRESDEDYNAMFVRFFDEFGFFKKLAEARAILSDTFSNEVGHDGMDELERELLGLKYWKDKSE
jgi:hypothetical protein